MRNVIIGIAASCLFILAVGIRAPVAQAQTPKVVGHGCTTAYFIDDDCDGCGVGVKSSGQYPVNPSAPVGTPANYTMGDKPDADDTDPTVCTTAQWQAKWGATNAGMVNFLQQRKSFSNTSRIFYVSQNGDDASGAVNDPAHPYRSMAPILTQLEDLKGGAVIIRAGKWTDLDFRPCSFSHGNPCFNISGSVGNPVYVMAYPGELVQTQLPVTSVTYKPYPNVCCVTFDGLEFFDPTYGVGDGFSTASTTDYSIKNSEFAGWHQIIFSSHSVNTLVEDNVFHDMMYHTVYFAFDKGLSQGPGDFDFSLDQARYLAGQSDGASYHGQVIGNVMYGNGAAGYEPIHINAYMDYPVVEGNIVSYSGGSGLALQTGVYNAWIADNIFFDNGRDCITLYLYDHPGMNLPTTIRWTTIQNNTCYEGPPSDVIRGSSPGGGIVQDDGSGESGHYIKDTKILNNVIVTYDDGASIDPLPFKFETNSYPETDTIQGNLIWSAGPTSGRVMVISNDASPNGGAGTYNFSQFQAFNTNFSGNEYADPQFASVSPTFTLTPGAFNFAASPSSPASGIGANLALPLPVPPPVPPPPTASGTQSVPSAPSNLTVTSH